MPLPFKKRILIIDDDETFGEVAVRVLGNAGFAAYFHRGARGALEALRRTDYDAVLLDVNMPHIDGPQLLRMMRDTHSIRQMKLILCSNMHPGALQMLAQRFGAHHALPKPEDPQQLARALQALWLAPPLHDDRGAAKISSVPPASETRVKQTIAPPSAPPAAAYDHPISIEPPDLVVVKACGDLSDAAFHRVQTWTEQRPYYILLLDMPDTVCIHLTAREQIVEWARRLPPQAIAAFGSNFQAQIIFEMLHRAISRLSGQPLHRYFAPNEAAARAWLAEIRPHLAHSRRFQHAL